MGNSCKGLNCANPGGEISYLEKVQQVAMNKTGKYLFEQIKEVVNTNWKSQNPSNEDFIKQDKCEQISRDVINFLGEQGNGITFDKSKFELVYERHTGFNKGEATIDQTYNLIQEFLDIEYEKNKHKYVVPKKQSFLDPTIASNGNPELSEIE